MTVSYTHLDVYKRQLLFSCGTVDPFALWKTITFSTLLQYVDPKSPLANLFNQMKSKVFKTQTEDTQEENDSRALLTQLNQSGLGRPMLDLYKALVTENTDLSRLDTLGYPVFACAYDIEAHCPVYFDLTKQSKDLVTEIVLASCAVPHVFPAIPVSYTHLDVYKRQVYGNAQKAAQAPGSRG